jgi:hypothetical protein
MVAVILAAGVQFLQRVPEVFKTSEMLLWYLGWLPKDRLLI